MCRVLIVNILLLKYVNFFKCTEISEYIHEVVVETSYKKPTGEYANFLFYYQQENKSTRRLIKDLL